MAEWQYLLNIAFGLFTGIIGWFCREMWNAVNGLKADVAKLREELPKTYLAKDDFGDFRRELFQALTRIETKLDSKADK